MNDDKIQECVTRVKIGIIMSFVFSVIIAFSILVNINFISYTVRLIILFVSVIGLMYSLFYTVIYNDARISIKLVKRKVERFREIAKLEAARLVAIGTICKSMGITYFEWEELIKDEEFVKRVCKENGFDREEFEYMLKPIYEQVDY